MKIKSITSNLSSELKTLTTEHQKEIHELQNKTKKLIDASTKFDRNWIGHWASSDYNLYTGIYEDAEYVLFEEDEVKNYAEEVTNIEIEEVKEKVSKISGEYRSFQNKLITELSIINGNESFNTESKLLSEIEAHRWGMPPSEYVKSKTPGSLMLKNPYDINRRLKTPPHIIIGGKLMSLYTTLHDVKDFEKLSLRILRQLEIKLSIEKDSDENASFILSIINSFHFVARQIEKRHDNRKTLSINDEYDVQDLLHGLLKIEFGDVRPEEYTPSYAGSSTRVDFLLKKIKTVIEVKMTRKGLKDKQIGDQLILDTQHYKTHPDCKRLICFVYDPENRIQNPRGLEDDLNDASTDYFIVEVFIRP